MGYNCLINYGKLITGLNIKFAQFAVWDRVMNLRKGPKLPPYFKAKLRLSKICYVGSYNNNWNFNKRRIELT